METQPARMPALFIGHGSPTNTLELNGFTRAWRALGEALPLPRAILVVSAHWFIGATAVTAMARPRAIHDFYGFPEHLFDFRYPASGSPKVAQEVVEAVNPIWVGLDRDQWGLDHGHVERSCASASRRRRSGRPAFDQCAPAVRLSPRSRHPALRDDGVLVLSSGNVVHDLRLIEWNRPTDGADWAGRFDEAVMAQMAADPSAILKLVD